MNTFRTTMRQILLATVIALMPLAAIAQDFDKGWRAYAAGDFATALKEWRPLAEQGDHIAQNLLGDMYAEGLGVPQDNVEAVRWYRLAVDQGFDSAQNSLGSMYAQGRGVPQDFAEAIRLFRLAGDNGYAPAWNNLGSMYAEGKGVLQDYVTAHMWFNIAEALGGGGGESRDEIAELMTPEQVAEALRRARVCFESNYKDCD